MNGAIERASDGWVDTRIESYVDGALSTEERRTFEAAVDRDPALRETIGLARQLKVALHSIEAPPCPPHVTANVLQAVRSEPGMAASMMERLAFLRRVWQPALVAAATIVLAIILIRPGAPAPEAQYTDADVAAALAEVQWTLAYLNGVGSRTGQTIRHQVLAEGVVRPMQVGLGIVDSSAKSN